MCRLNFNFKNFRWDTGLSHLGGQSSFTMCRLNLNFKILGEILVSHTYGVNHLSPCAGWILTLKNFNWDTGLSYLGGQSSFTMPRLNLKFKILGEILVTPNGGVNHLLMSMVTLILKIVPETMISDTGGSIILGTGPSSKFVTFC